MADPDDTIPDRALPATAPASTAPASTAHATTPSAPKAPAPPPPIHRLAIRALVCAGLGFSVLPVVGTILGFILAARAQRALAATPGRYRGEDQIHWARLLGYLAMVLWVVGLFVVMVARYFMHHEPMV